MPIEIRKLGSQGLEASVMGLGCMGMSDFYGDADEKESIAVIHRALEMGVNFLDTSDMYGPFKNERLLGRAMKGRRDRVVLATKFGIVRDDSGAFKGLNGSPEYARKACDASLQRLEVDCIDLYYLHRPDPNVPIEESVGAMAELVEAGKVRHIGLSEVTADQLRRGHGVHPITALQSEYSLWCREPEPEILPACRELGVGFVPFSPLGRGFLTGAFKSPDDLPENDWRRTVPRFQGENFKRNLELVACVEKMAEKKGCTPAQLGLAWVLAQGDDMFPIPGTKRMKYLEENVAALDVRLTAEELAEIEKIFPLDAAAGGRFPNIYKDKNKE